MTKVAILFSGQGAQKPGMGKSLYEGDSAAKAIFDKAESVFPGIKELCFEASQEELNKTENTQPATFVCDVAAYAALKSSADIEVCAMAGFSLGEYAAVAAAGVLPFEDVLKVVVKRAQWMSECAGKNPGCMAAVMGKTPADLLAIIDEVKKEDGLLIMANYNCPGQIVVSGDLDNMDAFLGYCKQNRVKAIKLAVSGAFHSKAMSEAEENLRNEFAGMDMVYPAFALYSNVTGLPYKEDELKELLAQQVSSPVRFEDTVRDIIKDDSITLIECGEGKVLSGLVRKTNKETKVLNVSDIDTLNACTEEL